MAKTVPINKMNKQTINNAPNSKPIQLCSNATCISIHLTEPTYIWEGKTNDKRKQRKGVSYKLSRVTTTMQNGANMYASPCVLGKFNLKRFLNFDFKTFNYSCSYSIFKSIFILSNSFQNRSYFLSKTSNDSISYHSKPIII